MKLTFLGTRGEIEARTPIHRMHSAMMVSWRRSNVMIDCGNDWLQSVAGLSPDAILITHAHPDHAGGLRNGVSCPVFATEESWRIMRPGAIPERRCIEPQSPFEINGIRIEAFEVEHSLLAPAVGYRVSAGAASVFYVPDVVSIHDQRTALTGVHAYIGDGAAISRSILRKRGNVFIGHASIRTQLEWCREEGVRRAFFTHCGTEIVTADERVATDKVSNLARRAGVETRIAFDGMNVVLGRSSFHADQRFEPRDLSRQSGSL